MIKLNGNVTHDKVEYKTGETIENIDKAAATRLVNLGVAVFISDILQEIGKVEVIESHDAEELDSTYEYSDLKELAKEIGMEFPNNITKAKLIEQIIYEDKVEQFFEQEENEDI